MRPAPVVRGLGPLTVMVLVDSVTLSEPGTSVSLSSPPRGVAGLHLPCMPHGIDGRTNEIISTYAHRGIRNNIKQGLSPSRP